MPTVVFAVGEKQVTCTRPKKPKGPWTWEVGGVVWRYFWWKGGQLEGDLQPPGSAFMAEFNQLHDAVFFTVGFACGVTHHAELSKG